MRDVILTTARLVLRPVGVADRAALNRWMNDWSVAGTLAVPAFPHPMAETDLFIADCAAAAARGEACRLAVVADGDCIGVASIDAGARGDVLGYWLAATHWGRGLMTEAASCLVAFWFATRPVAGLRSGAFAGNGRSLRVQEKLGFQVVGESMEFSRPLGRAEPHVDTWLDRAAWLERQGAADGRAHAEQVTAS